MRFSAFDFAVLFVLARSSVSAVPVCVHVRIRDIQGTAFLVPRVRSLVVFCCFSIRIAGLSPLKTSLCSMRARASLQAYANTSSDIGVRLYQVQIKLIDDTMVELKTPSVPPILFAFKPFLSQIFCFLFCSTVVVCTRLMWHAVTLAPRPWAELLVVLIDF